MNPSRPNHHHLALLFIILLAVALRLAYLAQPMRYDEAFTFLNYASKPLPQALTQYDQPNNHLFHTLLVHISTSLLGDSPQAIRLPAFFAGIALVPLVYAVTRQHYHADAGLLAAGLVASSSVLVEFSTNARGYTIVCCLFVALLGIAPALKKRSTQPLPPTPLLSPPLRVRGGGRGEGLRTWLTFAILSALGMYTIPTMLYPLGIVVVWLALSIGQPRRLPFVMTLLLTACLTLALYLPVIIMSGLNSLTANEWVQPLPTFPLPVRVVADQAWWTWNRDILAPLQVILVAGFIASLLYHRRIASYRIPVFVAALLWLIPLVVVQRVSGFPRTWLFLLPLYFMMASAGIVYVLQIAVKRVGASPRPTLIPIASLAISIILGASVLSSQSVLASEETGALPGAQAFTRLLDEQFQDGDGILALRPADAPLEYYFQQSGITFPVTDLASKARLFVIVYEPAQSLADTLTRAGLSLSDYAPAQRIEQIGSAVLYLLVNQTLT